MKTVIHICLALAIIFGLGTSSNAAEYKYNMSYIYFGNYDNYTYYVDETEGSINEISPHYFSLNRDGSLDLTSSVSKEFVSDMHDRGILVVPFLSNDWNRAVGIAAINNRDALSDQLAAAVEEYNLDGVNIDVENVTESERESYVDFVRLLREKLPRDKTVAVSVAANPYYSDSGWQGSYDYAGLAAYSDYLMIMAYDEHYQSGPPGPVSSLSFVENSVKYALDHVSKDKILLGLPFYGRIWSDSGGYPQGYGVSNVKIEQYISEYRGKIVFDEATQSTKVSITVKPGDRKPVMGGRTLGAGTYTIWFESQRSIKSKLALVTKYDIKGTGSWSLGQEKSDTWAYYKYRLNGCNFEDIENNWAKEHIFQAYMNGWISGFSPERFGPKDTLTRAQAAAMMVRILGLKVEKNNEHSFDDCAGSWAEQYINTARKHNIVSGMGDNLFMPESPVSRQEIAVMLNNILRYRSNGSVQVFSDVSGTQYAWSIEAIHALSENDVITGYPDGSFRPLDNITRAEMTALLTRVNLSQ